MSAPWLSRDSNDPSADRIWPKGVGGGSACGSCTAAAACGAAAAYESGDGAAMLLPDCHDCSACVGGCTAGFTACTDRPDCHDCSGSADGCEGWSAAGAYAGCTACTGCPACCARAYA